MMDGFSDVNLSVIESKASVSISNERIGLKFRKGNVGYGLINIRSIKDKHNFLYKNCNDSRLWELKLKHRSNEVKVIDNSCKCRKSHFVEKADNGREIIFHMYWEEVTLDGWGGEMNVHVTVRMNESPFTFWQIEVENNSSQYGLWEITFPLIKGLDIRKKSGVHLAYPDYHGCLIKNPAIFFQNITPVDPSPPGIMNYPSARCTMQFSTLYDTLNHNGLYLATHDSSAYVKKFGYDSDRPGRTLEYKVMNYPENMGVPGNNSYKMPYEVIVGIYNGDWITASKLYRDWAVDQKWCSKGKLINRSDIPEWYLNSPAWFMGNATDNLIPAGRFLNIPVIFQWFNWHQIPFDINYPDYFPAKPEFSALAELYKTNNLKIIPYINARLWDINSKAWEKEKPYNSACKVPALMINELISLSRWPDDAWRDLMIYMEHYAGSSQAVMCPTSKEWEEKLSEIIMKLVSEYKVDGVYLDQTASCMPVYCFDPSHGHPVGGGKYWVESTRTMIANCKAEARQVNREVVFTTEDSAEPYMDLFEGFLAFNNCNISDKLIPMFQYVYSGYCITYGRCFNNDPLAFRMKNTQMFLWGEQIGWFPPVDSTAFANDDAVYFKELCNALMNKEVRKYLFYGEMIRPPVLHGDFPVLSAQWRPNQRSTDMPAVAHSAWKAEDGSVGLVFANMDNHEHVINYDFDMNMFYHSLNSSVLSAEIIYGPGLGKINRYDDPKIYRNDTIPERSVLVIEYKPL